LKIQKASEARKNVILMFSLMTFHRNVAKITRRVPLAENGMLTLPEHLSSPPVFFSEIRSVLWITVCFILASFIVCPSLINSD
jgi:hypothetical protein